MSISLFKKHAQELSLAEQVYQQSKASLVESPVGKPKKTVR